MNERLIWLTLRNAIGGGAGIRALVMQGDVMAASDILRAAYPECVVAGSDLDFQLKCNQFIELVQKGRMEDAIGFGQEHLTVFQDNPTYRSKLEVCTTTREIECYVAVSPAHSHTRARSTGRVLVAGVSGSELESHRCDGKRRISCLAGKLDQRRRDGYGRH